MADIARAITDILGAQPQAGAIQYSIAPGQLVSPVDAALADLQGKGTPAKISPAATEGPVSPVIDPESGQLIAGSTDPNDLHGNLLNSPVGGFVRGVRDPIDALAQLAARGMVAATPSGPIGDWAQKQLQDVEAANKAAETDYEQNWRGGAPPGFDVGRMVGNVALSAPLIAAAGPEAGTSALARLGYGALTGAAAGGMTPIQNPGDSFWSQKGTQMGLGGALGAVPPVIGGALSRVVSPNASEGVQQLMALGVNPTPGQIMGGSLNRMEEGLGSVPIIGDFIRAGRSGALQEYNRGVINSALAPIGESLDAATPIGRQAIDEMQQKISGNLDQFKELPQVAVHDPQFATEIGGLMSGTDLPLSLPPDRLTQLNTILNSKLLGRFEPDGTMTGENFQRATSDLGAEARSLMHYGNDSDQRALGLAVQDAQTSLRDLLDRTADPAVADAARNNNAAYAAMLRVQGAAGARGAEEGVFSPAQLSASVRAFDPTKGKRAFASGNAMMQDISDAGVSVLGNKVPDSGTPLRSLMALGGGALGATALGHGGISLPDIAMALGGAGLASSVYSAPARSALARLMVNRPDYAPALAQGIQQAVPYGSALLGRGVPGLGQ
jgi:hypothetical protein